MKDEDRKDDQWIMDHAAELKAELLDIAKSGKPKPEPHTLLGRALVMFTTKRKQKRK